MKNWNERCRHSPTPHISYLLTIVAILASMPANALSAWFEPRMIRHENCTPQRYVSAVALKKLSVSDTLYVTRPLEGGDSSTAQLLRKEQLKGAISFRPVYAKDTEIRDAQHFLITGGVYERIPSALEEFFGGTERQYYYEVLLENERFVLYLGTFESPPFDTCL